MAKKKAQPRRTQVWKCYLGKGAKSGVSVGVTVAGLENKAYVLAIVQGKFSQSELVRQIVKFAIEFDPKYIEIRGLYFVKDIFHEMINKECVRQNSPLYRIVWPFEENNAFLFPENFPEDKQ